MNDLCGIIGEDLLEGHHMPNMFSNTNPASTLLVRAQHKIGVIHHVIDRFKPLELQRWTNVWCRTGNNLERETEPSSALEDV
jgi:hypothetical protein